MLRLLVLGLSIVIIAWLSACTAVGPDYQRPSVATEINWSAPEHDNSLSEAHLSQHEFWVSFHDVTLLHLIDKANQHNPTLQSAFESIHQAQLVLQSDRAGLFPSAELTGASTYAQPTLLSELKGTNYGATTNQLFGQLSWELDFWGHIRRQIESDHASVKAAMYAVKAAQLSLEASIASSYCNLRMVEAQIAVAQVNLSEQAEDLRIAEVRYRYGATSERDYRQAQTQYEQTQSQIPALKSALAQYQHALSVLVGETPDYFIRHEIADAGLPELPQSLPLGAPYDLLRRRPDVMQAELNAIAQSARIGVAEAALYPSFSLTGGFGYSGTNGLSTMFQWDNRAASVGLSFTLPIFDRDRLHNLVNIQDSVFRQALLAYQNQVLKAQQEVEDALAQMTNVRAQLAGFQRGDNAAVRSAELALRQYRAGQTDYTTVSSAEQAHLQTSNSVVQAQGSLLQAYISAFRAIGGGWDESYKN